MRGRMGDSISLSWEWILGTAVTLILIFLSWIVKQLYDLKKDYEPRLRFLENENSAKTEKINLIEKVALGKFEKEEEKKNARK